MQPGLYRRVAYVRKEGSPGFGGELKCQNQYGSNPKPSQAKNSVALGGKRILTESSNGT
jgi:hypothetical protein